MATAQKSLNETVERQKKKNVKEEVLIWVLFQSSLKVIWHWSVNTALAGNWHLLWLSPISSLYFGYYDKFVFLRISWHIFPLQLNDKPKAAFPVMNVHGERSRCTDLPVALSVHRRLVIKWVGGGLCKWLIKYEQELKVRTHVSQTYAFHLKLWITNVMGPVMWIIVEFYKNIIGSAGSFLCIIS